MTKIADNIKGLPGEYSIYSLTGNNADGVLEEIFLFHPANLHPNEYQSYVINAVGRLRKNGNFEQITIHDIAKYLEKKFEFRRFSFYNCLIWDKERKVICETSVRG